MALSRLSMLRTIASLPLIWTRSPPVTFQVLDANTPIEEENSPYYDPKHVLPVELGVLLNNRYQIAGKLGHGSACTVWLARDTQKWLWQTQRFVALKVGNNTARQTRCAEHEIEISKCLATKNRSHNGFPYVRTVLDSFTVKGPSGNHLCLAFEPMREPLWLFQRRCAEDKFSSTALKAILRFLLKGLDYLHSECHIIHTDLKPANILLELENEEVIEQYVQAERDEPCPRKRVDDRWIYLSRNNFGHPEESLSGRLRIADFDMAAWGEEPRPKGKIIQLNNYRAPEVLLHAGWSYSADIWNLGVMLWDLLENKPLFPYEEYDEEAHLAGIISLLGPPPRYFLSQAEKAERYFDNDGSFRKAGRISTNVTLEDSVPSLEGEDKKRFLDFVGGMLRWVPEDRKTAKELLEHPWFRGHSYIL